MNSLNEINLFKILPDSLTKDDFIVALAEAVERELKEAYREAEILSNLKNSIQFDDLLLEHLLDAAHITANEGKSLAITKEEKVNLINNSFEMHRIKGTKAALEQILRLLNMNGKIVEWFEDDSAPYFFKIDIQVNSRGIGNQELEFLDRLIENYKNKRSWLKSINLFLTGSAKLYHATTCQFGEEATIFPWNETQIEMKTSYSIGSAVQTVETLTVYPS